MDNDKNTGNNQKDKKSTGDETVKLASTPQHEDESPPETVTSPEKVSASESKKPPIKKKPSAPKKPPGGRRIVNALIVLLLLLAIAGLGVAGWWFYQLQQKEPLVQENVPSQQADIQRLEDQLAEGRRERLKQQDVLSRAISELQLNINSHARRLRELSTTSRTDWLLAEAEYLIRLANQRLITERNTKNATALLMSADEILRDLDEVGLLAVREALAKNITLLRMAPSVDREGLYLQLNALSEQLVRLPLIAPAPEKSPDTNIEPTNIVSDSWQGRLLQGFYTAVKGVGELIRVRHRSAPVEPLLSPEEDQFLRHNLGMMLEQAQLALLREEQSVYQASLVKVQEWLGNYFELNESARQLVDQVSQLEQKNVVQQLPDISGGLEALKDYIDSWHKRHTVEGTEEQQGEQQ